MNDTAPARGFPRAEYEARAERARALMTAHELDALFVTSEQHVRYFTGFDSQFWASPTRPWFVIVPREGELIAVIPEIGGQVMAQTWVTDIRTWPAPVPEDDGVTLLADVLSSLPRRFGRIGAEMGPEMVLRMPAADFLRISETIAPQAFVDGTPVLRALRGVKSPAEIDKVRHACQLTSEAFLALPEKLHVGMTEWEACRDMRVEVLRRGADNSPYMMGVAGQGGYDNIIMGPTQKIIDKGDILIIDTGTTFDGYFCDFDRNFAFGEPDDAAKRAHETVWNATQAGIDAARPGATTTDLWRAMAAVLEKAGSLGNNVGRMGHGLGMQLTEWPSNRPGDDTPLVPGMVMTIEPGMEFAPGRMMVHEENIAITEDGSELLTIRAAKEMPVVE
ncbi:MAG: Xaa-Pro peptidase family protein [Alphaproteobacteria bacterium]|nr:Xaa-Pro peptidase family protein [Alphaproteobacteria bacterium]